MLLIQIYPCRSDAAAQEIAQGQEEVRNQAGNLRGRAHHMWLPRNAHLMRHLVTVSRLHQDFVASSRPRVMAGGFLPILINHLKHLPVSTLLDGWYLHRTILLIWIISYNTCNLLFTLNCSLHALLQQCNAYYHLNGIDGCHAWRHVRGLFKSVNTLLI